MSRNISFFITCKHRLAPLTGVNSSYESITAVSGGNDNFTKKQTVKKSFLSCTGVRGGEGKKLLSSSVGSHLVKCCCPPTPS